MTELEKGTGMLLEDLECILELISSFPKDQDSRSLLLTRVLLSEIPFRIRQTKDTLASYLEEHRAKLESGI
jgi:hypothetical protein